MDDRVLVAYASKYGATAEIAEKISRVLNEAGVRAEVLPADRVNDLSPYTAVVLGSAVYMGRWRKEAAGFLKDNQAALAGRLTWLFSSGPTGKGDPVELMKGWNFPRVLRPAADNIQPRDIALFNGALDKNKLSAVGKWMIKNVKAPQGDFRDWDAITSWAHTIVEDLKKKASDQ